MGLIVTPFREIVEYGGRKYRSCAAFDIVLMVQKMYKDERLTDADRLEQALVMLIRNHMRVRCLSQEKKAGLLHELYEQQIKTAGRPAQGPQKRVLDFDLDGEYIYASFLQDYGIDLIEQQGILHWKKFCALFEGLSEETKIKQIIHIRSMEVPPPNRHNQKEIQNIMELKSYYALPVVGGGGKEGLDLLFSTLERMAGT